MILGMAQGLANMGMLPIPEIHLLAAVLLQRPVPQPDAGAGGRAGLPEGLRWPFPQRQLDHRAARHPWPGGRLPVARRRCGDDAAHAGRAGAGGWAGGRVP
ncbi:hypothetical protein G6F57_019566 [Rhizopus arrhizus]|nr:hypothetical protein G6F40_014591 [Rhizopus arrhizus]KAG1439092.1 hypothetical protein G6F57_019566 [Rhizopus arrhizus]